MAIFHFYAKCFTPRFSGDLVAINHPWSGPLLIRSSPCTTRAGGERGILVSLPFR